MCRPIIEGKLKAINETINSDDSWCSLILISGGRVPYAAYGNIPSSTSDTSTLTLSNILPIIDIRMVSILRAEKGLRLITNILYNTLCYLYAPVQYNTYQISNEQNPLYFSLYHHTSSLSFQQQRSLFRCAQRRLISRLLQTVHENERTSKMVAGRRNINELTGCSNVMLTFQLFITELLE